MNKLIFLIIGLFVSIGAIAEMSQEPSNNQDEKCQILARKLVNAAFQSETSEIFPLIETVTKEVMDEAGGGPKNVTTLTFQSEGAVVVVETLPNYYPDNECQTESLNIYRQ